MSNHEIITFSDSLRKNLKDEATFSKRPRGRVQIFEHDNNDNKILVQDTSNLILYGGRQWLLKRAFEQSTRTMDPDAQYTQNSDLFISWFGIGTKGCNPGDILLPIAPMLTNTAINQSTLGVPSLIDDSVTSRCLLKPDSIYKGRLAPINTPMTYIEDPENQGVTLIAKVDITLDKNEANGDGVTSYTDINEAGLYISNTKDTTETSIFNDSVCKLFARVTFSTIRKYSERKISFSWYIYF